jgi:sugar phosphate isomerase/epimerase
LNRTTGPLHPSSSSKSDWRSRRFDDEDDEDEQEPTNPAFIPERGRYSGGMNQIPVAVQLYTVRALCAKDFLGTLSEVAKIGYRHVELAGMHGLTAKELKKALDDLALTPTSAHMAPEPVEKTLDDCRALGIRYAVCGVDRRKLTAAQGCREAAQFLDAAGARLRAGGVHLCYHNHNWEFEKVDGRYALDRLYEASDPQNLHAQLDVFWIQRGGEDPVAYLRKLGSRCALLHLKDMAPDGDFAEVGSGTLDFPAILAAGREAGVRAFIVEQDTCKRPPLESIRMSLEYLRTLGAA